MALSHPEPEGQMNRVTLDEARRVQLGCGTEETEIFDAEGNIVGYFVPAARYAAIMTERKWAYDYAMSKCTVSEEQLRER
jgi:hypothetical protein